MDKKETCSDPLDANDEHSQSASRELGIETSMKNMAFGLRLDEDEFKKIAHRSLMLLMQNSQDPNKGILIKGDITMLKNDSIRICVIQVAADTLGKFNHFALILEDMQYVAVIRGPESALYGMLTTCMHSIHMLPHKIICAFMVADMYQNYGEVKRQVRSMLHAWISTLVDENGEFWAGLRDRFMDLMAIRRFRLELDRNKADLSPEIAELIAKFEEDAKLSKEGESKNFVLDPSDYVVSDVDRKYAQAYEVKFREKSTDTYYSELTHEELEMIINGLVKNNEQEMLCYLWCILATSFDYYHFTFNPLFGRHLQGYKSTMRLYIRHFIYLMYKEECCVKDEISPSHRFVMSLRQLEACDLLHVQLNDNHNGDLFLPVSETAVKLTDSISSHSISGFRTVDAYKSVLHNLSMGVLKDLKIEGIIITGGLSAFCSIKRHIVQPYMPSRTDTIDSQKRLCRDSNLHSAQEILLQYAGSDLDLAIFVDKDEEFKQKLTALESHILQHWPSDVKHIEDVHVSFTQVATTNKYRFILPNGLALEAFKMIRSYRNPLSMIYDFHVGGVRQFYDPIKDDVFLLPSCLWAGWTGMCVDIKYFSSNNDPMTIVKKYMRRGFSFLLNDIEANMLDESCSDLSVTLGDKRRFASHPLVAPELNIWDGVKIRTFNYPSFMCKPFEPSANKYIIPDVILELVTQGEALIIPKLTRCDYSLETCESPVRYIIKRDEHKYILCRRHVDYICSTCSQFSQTCSTRCENCRSKWKGKGYCDHAFETFVSREKCNAKSYDSEGNRCERHSGKHLPDKCPHIIKSGNRQGQICNAKIYDQERGACYIHKNNVPLPNLTGLPLSAFPSISVGAFSNSALNSHDAVGQVIPPLPLPYHSDYKSSSSSSLPVGTPVMPLPLPGTPLILTNAASAQEHLSQLYSSSLQSELADT